MFALAVIDLTLRLANSAATALRKSRYAETDFQVALFLLFSINFLSVRIAPRPRITRLVLDPSESR